MISDDDVGSFGMNMYSIESYTDIPEAKERWDRTYDANVYANTKNI